MTATKGIRLLLCTLLIGFASAIEDPGVQRSQCAEDLARYRERLENFNFTFQDPRQVKLFKYLSAKSFGRAVPTSALKSQLKDFPHLDLLPNHIFSDLDHYKDLHSLCKRGEEVPNIIKPGPHCEAHGWKVFREIYQRIRDLHIDCWNSGESSKFLDPRLSILPLDYPKPHDPSDACDQVFDIDVYFNKSSDAFDQMHRIEECDEAQWRNLTGYTLICRRPKPIEVEMKEIQETIVSLDEIGDEIRSLFALSAGQVDQNDTVDLIREQVVFEGGEFDRFFINSSAYSLWKGLPFFGSNDSFNDAVLDALGRLVANETTEVKTRALRWWKRFRTEMVIVERSKSELESRYVKNRYVFDTSSHDLLKLVKAAGSNWRFKYVYIAEYDAFEVSMHNETVSGQFIDDSGLPRNEIVERIRRLLNGFIRLYWDIKKTRGVLPQEPADEDYVVTCRYKKLYDLRGHDRYDKFFFHWSVIEESSRPDHYEASSRFRNTTNILDNLFRRRNISDDRSDDDDVFVKMARLTYDTFKNNDSDTVEEVNKVMRYLLAELCNVEKLSPIFYPTFVYDKGFFAKCKADDRCEFLLTLHMIGSAFDLKFVDKSSEEVLINKSGFFVYFHGDGESAKSREVRYLLNYVVRLFFGKHDYE